MATGTFRSDLQSDITRADHERFPELFYEGPMIDRSKATRVVPMRVMVFGLMRTGTSSMRVALSRMGFDEVYHMVSVWHNPDDAQWWQRAADASWENKGTFTREDWDKLLGHCQAVCDIPPAAFATELIEAYPEAKVVILNRDVDQWYQSVNSTVLLVAKKTIWKKIRCLIEWRRSGQLQQVLGRCMYGLFGENGLNEANMKQSFIEYHENLRRIVPPERRLEMTVKDGYKPLCEFLGVPVPTKMVNEKEVEEPFPYVNEGSVFRDRMQLSRKLENRRIAKKVSLVGSAIALIGVGIVYLRRSS